LRDLPIAKFGSVKEKRRYTREGKARKKRSRRSTIDEEREEVLRGHLPEKMHYSYREVKQRTISKAAYVRRRSRALTGK